ncbi:MAG: sarcosine oxidase subunit delta [Pseudomonadota bacterium]
MRIPCPICGIRDSGEFTYCGDATVKYPALDADQDAWYEAVFERRNPSGPHTEYWHHTAGCRRYIIVERDTRTHEVFGARLPHEPGPDEQAKQGKAPRRKPSPKRVAQTSTKNSGNGVARPAPKAGTRRRPGSKTRGGA